MSDTQRKSFEEHLELDLAFDLGETGRFRVNVFMQAQGEAAVFRHIPTKIRSIEELRLPLVLKTLCDRERGLILFTGPTGSGKTTSQAAMIDLINMNYQGHIVTIEDPIEFIHGSKQCLVNQRELGTHTHSFANALRAVLREDPDVILVGEMRDLETIQLALTAAETGHLVFATLHSQSATATVDRVIDVFPAAQQQQIRTQFADSVEAIITQTLCKSNDGGLVPAIEVLLASYAVRNLIREKKTHQLPSLMQAGRKEGMQTMDTALVGLVQEGFISPVEARRKSMTLDLSTQLGGYDRAVGDEY
jgi:twitching motility protein PilT